MSRLIFSVYLILSVYLTAPVYTQSSQKTKIDKILVKSVSIFNQDTISFILDQLLIPEKRPSRIDIIDIDKNGFGNYDVLRTFYQVSDSFKISKVYFLEDLSDTLSELLNRFEPKPNMRLDVANLDQETFESFRTPFYAILGALVEGLNRNYNNHSPISIGMKRDEQGITIQFWGYDSTRMKYHPLQPKQNIFYIYTIEKDSIIISK